MSTNTPQLPHEDPNDPREERIPRNEAIIWSTMILLCLVFYYVSLWLRHR